MTVHDVTRELRDPSGKWSKSGHALQRMAKEAEGAAASKESGKLAAGHRVKYKTGATGVVHHVDEKGTPHVVWDRGRGKPVRTPAHHLTRTEGEAKPAEKAATTEKAARAQIARDWRKEKLGEIGMPGKYRQPTPEAQRGEISKRAGEAAAVSDKWMGKQATITSGPHAGITGKVVQADRYGVTIQASDGTRYTPGHNQFREARSGGAKSPDELRKMIADAEAKAKAAQEAENRSRLPGGSQTVYDKPFHRAGGETQEYLRRMRGGSNGPDIDSRIARVESQFREGGISYSPQDLVDTRLHEVMDDLKNYPKDKTVTVKVPSGSEVQIPRDVAEELVRRVQKANRKSYGFRY